MDNKPMTAEERSNRVFNFICHEWAGECKDPARKGFIQLIAAEIKAAVDAGQKEVLEQNEVLVQVRLDAAYRRGVDDATLVEREICAKIADEATRQDSGQDIARRIRALKSKEEA